MPLLHPEDLSQGDRRAVGPIDEDAEDDRVGVAGAKPHSPAAARELVLLAFVVTGDVAAQGALALLGARGLVVGDLLRWHEQGRHGIDHCRLA